MAIVTLNNRSNTKLAYPKIKPVDDVVFDRGHKYAPFIYSATLHNDHTQVWDYVNRRPANTSDAHLSMSGMLYSAHGSGIEFTPATGRHIRLETPADWSKGFVFLHADLTARSGLGCFFSLRGFGSNPNTLIWRNSDTTLNFRVNGSTTTLTHTPGIYGDGPKCLIVSWDDATNERKLFVDGVLSQTKTTSFSWSNNSSNLAEMYTDKPGAGSIPGAIHSFMVGHGGAPDEVLADITASPYQVFRPTDSNSLVTFEAAAASITVNASPVTVSVGGSSSDVIQGNYIDTNVAHLSISGNAAEVSLQESIIVNASITSISLSGVQSSVELYESIIIGSNPSPIQVSGDGALVSLAMQISTLQSDLSFSGLSSEIVLESLINTTPETVSLTTNTAEISLTNDVTINASPADISLSGISSLIGLGQTVSTNPADIVTSGSSSLVGVGVTIDSSVSAVTVDALPSSVSIVVSNTINTTPAGLNISGESVSVISTLAINSSNSEISISTNNCSIIAGSVVRMLFQRGIELHQYNSHIEIK